MLDYEGDPGELTREKMENISKYVVSKYWRISGSPPENFTLDISIVSDEEIRRVNRQYLGRDSVTDVISFPLMEGEEIPGEGVPLIGQVVISGEAAARQAVSEAHSYTEELTLLFIHGVLHVSGWEEGQEIEKCQKKILKEIKNRIL